MQRSSNTRVVAQRLSNIESICANIVLAGSSSITALIFAYYFYYYVWTDTRQFINWRGTVFYIVAPGSLSLFFLSSLGLSRSCKIKIALGCLALSALLLGLEGILRTKAVSVEPPFWGIDKSSYEKKKIITRLAKQFQIQFDTRDRVEVSDELIQRGIDAVPAVMIASLLYENGGRRFRDYTNGVEIVPIGAIAKRTTILCNESGEYVKYNSDEHGFRNPAGLWKSVRADVAAVGQSFVQGYCVPDEKNFVDMIRRYYPITLNLGRSGESPLLQLGTIKEYLPRYAPKTVLWFFCEDIDLYDLYFQARHSLLKHYLEPNFIQHLFDRQEEIDRMLGGFAADLEKDDRQLKRTLANRGLIDKLLEVTKLPNTRKKLDLVYGVSKDEGEYLHSFQTESGIWDVFRTTLLQARTVIANWGGSLYFVYLPSWGRFVDGSSVSDQHTRVLKVVSELGIPIIDLVPVFQSQKDPLSLFPLRVFGHYNEFGNQIVGDTVLKFLSARQQIAPFQP